MNIMLSYNVIRNYHLGNVIKKRCPLNIARKTYGLSNLQLAIKVYLIIYIYIYIGRGIKIFSNLTEIKNFLARRPTHTYWVVQKYLERPLLFSNRN